MKAVYIIVEGKTEMEFVNRNISPYFISKNIYEVRPISLNTSKGQKGGDVSYSRYKINAISLLKSRKDMIVTSLIDYFKLNTDFPEYDNSKKINEKNKRVDFLENAISEDINVERFIPYIQLHEFESLLFSEIRGFEEILEITKQSLDKIKEVITKYPNPEMINDSMETAPSKRLEKIIKSYNKVLHGNMIAEKIGIETIMKRCPRFGEWIEKLILKSK